MGTCVTTDPFLRRLCAATLSPAMAPRTAPSPPGRATDADDAPTLRRSTRPRTLWQPIPARHMWLLPQAAAAPGGAAREMGMRMEIKQPSRQNASKKAKSNLTHHCCQHPWRAQWEEQWGRGPLE